MRARLVAILPFVTALVLFLVLILSRRAQSRLIVDMRTEFDSVVASGVRAVEAQELLLQPGDSIPDIVLTGIRGTRSLKDLSPSYSHIYFYRPDCPACKVLESAWSAVPRDRLDSVLFVVVGASADADDSSGANRHWTWVVDSSDQGRFVQAVPTLLRLTTGDRVLTVVHGSLNHVAKFMEMEGFGSQGDIEQARLDYVASRRAEALKSAPPVVR